MYLGDGRRGGFVQPTTEDSIAAGPLKVKRNVPNSKGLGAHSEMWRQESPKSSWEPRGWCVMGSQRRSLRLWWLVRSRTWSAHAVSELLLHIGSEESLDSFNSSSSGRLFLKGNIALFTRASPLLQAMVQQWRGCEEARCAANFMIHLVQCKRQNPYLPPAPCSIRVLPRSICPVLASSHFWSLLPRGPFQSERESLVYIYLENQCHAKY